MEFCKRCKIMAVEACSAQQVGTCWRSLWTHFLKLSAIKNIIKQVKWNNTEQTIESHFCPLLCKMMIIPHVHLFMSTFKVDFSLTSFKTSELIHSQSTRIAVSLYGGSLLHSSNVLEIHERNPVEQSQISAFRQQLP